MNYYEKSLVFTTQESRLFGIRVMESSNYGAEKTANVVP